jgi:multiple antibiotic resistance protein
MFEIAATAFANFLITIDPIGVVPFFIALTHGFGVQARRKAALKSVAVAGAILLLFTLIGQPLLHYLGISLSAFRIAGGILLFILAVDMVMAKEGGIRAPTPKEEKDVAEHHPDVAVFPLAIPLLAGPGAIASTILLQAQHAGNLAAQVLVAGVMVAVLVGAAVCFFLADSIMRLLGLTGVNVLSRVLGIILAAMAVNNVIEGLRTSFPFLAV